MAMEFTEYYREYLRSTPREEWMRRLEEEDDPGKKGPHWSRNSESGLPCNGEWLTVTTRDGTKVRVILYRPKKRRGSVPVHFHIHGGGFSFGHAELNDYELSLYRDTLGIYCVGIEYILAPKRQYPEQLYDCYDVVKYFARHAESFGIDTERMSVGGESSGAVSATVLARMAMEGGEFRFKTQWLSSGCMDMYHDIKDMSRASAGFIEGNYLYWGSYCDRTKAKDSYISPFYATPEELKGMPVTIYAMAEDHLLADNMHYAKTLMEAGVTVRMKTFPGTAHCFMLHYPDTWAGKKSEACLSYNIEAFREFLL